jgi:DNA repair protein RecO (recombination protein O)
MFMTEVARKTIHGHEKQPELFRFLHDYFHFLDETVQFSNLHLHFMLQLTGFLGFLPGGEFSLETPVFDLKEGVFCESPPADHSHWLQSGLAEKLYLLLNLSKENSQNLPLSRDDRKLLLRALLDFYRLHIENLPTILSHTVFEEVLA